MIGGTSACNSATVTSVEVLDLSTRVWSQLPSSSDLPLSLDGAYHCGIAVGTKIYYFQENGVGVFDTTTLTWSLLTSPVELSSSLFCQATRVGPNDPTSTRTKIIITGPGDGFEHSSSTRVLQFKPATGAVTVLSMATVALAGWAGWQNAHTPAVSQAQAAAPGGSTLAERVAGAHSEGGEPVSDAERSAIDAIREALG